MLQYFKIFEIKMLENWKFCKLQLLAIRVRNTSIVKVFNLFEPSALEVI